MLDCQLCTTSFLPMVDFAFPSWIACSPWGAPQALEGTLSSYSHCILLLHFLQHTGLLPNLQEKPEQKPKEIPSCTYFLGSSEHGEIYELHTAIFMVNVMNLLRILGAPPYVEKNTCARLISCNKDR